MEARIEILPEKKLVGKRMRMTLADNGTAQLWQSFMPHRKAIKNKVNSDFFSMQVYDKADGAEIYNLQTEFEKWAAVEVTDFADIPDGLELYNLPGGRYAVFLHQGAASTAPKTFQYIFETWLPHSRYTLDDRPHFEILGEKYKNDDVNSEEEIWLPIRPKA